jgi:hypothetical protein
MSHRTSVKFSLLAALLMPGLMGCGEPKTLSMSEYIASLPAAMCSQLVRCGSIGPSERTSCERRVAAQSDRSDGAYSFSAAVTAGRLRFNGESAAACLRHLEGGRCDLDGGNRNEALACQRVFRPLVEDGGACQGSLECRSSVCEGSGQGRLGCPGVCAASTGCNYLNCSNDESCAPQTPQCVPRRGNGERCDTPFSHDICQPGLVCIDSTCRPPNPAGAACLGSEQCGAGLYCDRATSQCRERQAEGSACANDDSCRDGLLCAISSTTPDSGVCKRVLDFPSACDPALSTGACPSHAYCDPTSRTCVERTPTGGSCAGEPCLEIHYCDETTLTCQARLGVGAACTPPTSSDPTRNPCEGGRCDVATRRCVILCE